MENRIKEQQLGLFRDRTSCHAWWANQFRLLLSSAAYLLLETLRRLGLRGIELARATGGNHPITAPESRSGRHSQYATNPIVVEFELSPPRALLLLPGALLRLSPLGAGPGTTITKVANSRCLLMPLLRHHLARFSTEHLAIATECIRSLRQPSHDGKSGLEAQKRWRRLQRFELIPKVSYWRSIRR